MSTTDLWTVLGRFKDDLDFGGKLLLDLDGALREGGYALTDAEKEKARQLLFPDLPPFSNPTAPPAPEDLEYRRQKDRERQDFMLDRAKDLSQYTIKILKTTLNNAAGTYRSITLMNKMMFFSGITMFLTGSLCAVFFRDRRYYSLIIAGLGAANYISIFMLGAIEKTQVALSNLVQVEIAFMTFFEQMTLLEALAVMPRGNPPLPDPVNIIRGSHLLQQRSREIVELLQTFVEGPVGKPSPKA